MEPVSRPPFRAGGADVPDPVWPSIDWPAGPIGPPVTPFVGETEVEEKRDERRRDRWTLFLAIIGGVLLGTGVTLGVLGALGLLDRGVISVPRTTLVAAPTTTGPTPIAPGTTPSVSEVAATAIPSIVAVSVVTDDGLNGGGSGVVYSQDGYVLTNHHVVAGADAVDVIFSDGVSYSAEVIGSDPLTDIAVISTTRPDLTPIRLGTEADLVIGERTVAVGNPLGLLGGPSVTSGILSATGRSLFVEADTPLYGLLQTDAPITRGSSGGALLDQEAKLIGITTAIGISDVGAEGLGFAVPVDLAVSVADDLIADGTVRHAMLGIEGATVTEDREDANVPVGVGVSGITPGSGYGAAGGQIGDVIVALDGRPVTSIQQLIARLRTRRAGEEVIVRVLREDEELTFGFELGEWLPDG
ncbi:MAG TPA: trypsin-like peptidase domain-containing protein [Acidimicrobiia bacterium]|nr:trypsin-like peptidase domain-containing protein [Acidimicrobiia bacterium]